IIVTDHATFHLDSAPQFILVHDDPSGGFGKQRGISGMVGVEMGQDHILEISRLQIELFEPIDEQLIGLGMVLHRARVKGVLPVRARAGAHARINQKQTIGVLYRICINRMRDDAALSIDTNGAMVALVSVVNLKLIWMARCDQLEIQRRVSAFDDSHFDFWHRSSLLLLLLSLIGCYFKPGCSWIIPIKTPPVLFG